MWGRAVPAVAIATVVALAISGCGGGTATVVKTVTTDVPSPSQRLVLAHRAPGGPRFTLGPHIQSASGCQSEGARAVKTINVYPDTETCIRLAPRDRLLVINSTGEGGNRIGANPVRVSLGGYDAYVRVGDSALFPVAGSYLGIGLHEIDTHGEAPAPSVLVVPEGCSTRNPRPGEGLCFAVGAPRCPGSALRVRAARGGAGLGTAYQPFDVVNRSGGTCTVTGFPRLVAVDGHGRPIGPPARQDPGTTTMRGDHSAAIALGPGDSATFEMTYGQAANYSPSCEPRKSASLRINLPPAGPPQEVPYRMERCPHTQGFNVGRLE
jgi:hypothetical protein